MNPYLFWESREQPDVVRELTNSTSGSQDGYILCFKDEEEGAYPLTIEVKSTMTNPLKISSSSITECALSILEKKKGVVSVT